MKKIVVVVELSLPLPLPLLVLLVWRKELGVMRDIFFFPVSSGV